MASRQWATVIVVGGLTCGTMVAGASAQTSLATLRGSVADQQGGMLPGATVTVRQIDTNTTRTSVTEGTGQYFLTALPAGTYELTVELAGFATVNRPNVVLRVGQEAEINVVMSVGAWKFTVSMTSASPSQRARESPAH